MPELLLELFSEEIPARMQARAADDLARLATAGLKDAGLEHGDVRTFVTPRRLVLTVADLPEKQPDLREEKRGPRADAPDKAVEGFLKANGLTREQCEERDTGKGVFLFAVVEKIGAGTADVLPGLLSKVVAELPWQKSMRWGEGTMRWVRSLERILCVFGGKTLEIETRNAVPCGAATSGHRFLAPGVFEVSDFADYEAKLRAAHVILDREERKAVIAERAAAAAKAEGLTLRDDPGLLEEVAGLVEWPVVLTGKIDDAFMDVPDEVLTTSMRSHQKYFSLLNDDGSLAPRFVVVANTEAKDGGEAIIAGNERVLRARLSDAKFFWDQDRKVELESRIQTLAGSVFHARLGTMAQKVERITALAGDLAEFVPGCETDKAMRAARLAKADLATEMVYEFPELQGIMGRYYLLHEGHDADVADAVARHYSPAGPGDACPTAPVSVAVALADKLDTLVGFWVIGEKPTGSRDPFALRRAALGVIRIIIENGLRIPLSEVFFRAVQGYLEQDIEAVREALNSHLENTSSETAIESVSKVWADFHQNDLLEFFSDRLKIQLRERGVRHDLISAVFAVKKAGWFEDDFVRLTMKVDALSSFLATEDGANLLAAYKRASNIVSIEEKKGGMEYSADATEDRLVETQEKLLFQSLYDLGAKFGPMLDEERFDEAMAMLATLRGPVDDFFDHVTVNAEDMELRENRLRLLAKIREGMNSVAVFSEIEG